MRNNQQPVSTEDTDCRVEDPLCDFKQATCNDVFGLAIKSTSKFSLGIDVISTTMLKANIVTLTPVLTRIVNISIESSIVPTVMKDAIVTPLLKKRGVDTESLTNYRPISNLSFISKLLEEIVASQIRQNKDANVGW